MTAHVTLPELKALVGRFDTPQLFVLEGRLLQPVPVPPELHALGTAFDCDRHRLIDAVLPQDRAALLALASTTLTRGHSRCDLRFLDGVVRTVIGTSIIEPRPLHVFVLQETSTHGVQPETPAAGQPDSATPARSSEVDHLTGLGNRQALVRELDRCEHEGALVVVNLKNFSKINETYGGAVGDGVLRATGERLRLRMRAREQLCRINGDQFVAILHNTKSLIGVRRAKERLVATLKPTIVVDEVPHIVTAAADYTMFHPRETVESVVARAEHYLDLSKRKSDRLNEPMDGSEDPPGRPDAVKNQTARFTSLLPVAGAPNTSDGATLRIVN